MRRSGAHKLWAPEEMQFKSKVLFRIVRMKNVKVARNKTVYFGKSWIECSYKLYSVRLLFCGCFDGVAAWKKAYFIYFLLDERVFISSVMRCVHGVR